MKRVDWQDAEAEILAAAGVVAGPVVVGITGPVGAGKSTLARRLSACVLATDNYLPDYDSVPYEERDDPRHADFAGLARDLAELASGRAVEAPVWSFHTHRREGSRRVLPARLVVCEGIHALHAHLLPSLGIKVFVEAPKDVRWSRWEAIERSGERGWGVEKAREFFHTVAEPTFAAAEAAYRAAADFVVVNI